MMRCPRCNGHGEIPDPGTLGARLQVLRERAGVSQRAIARKSGVPIATYSRIEGGDEPSIKTLFRLADFFKVSVDYLVRGK